ncbi:RNA polymerase factor sigma-54 [Methylolobus aquaticus]|nr:RNA polymerase factor sigma-54 [Methylolobus aquaticus]
MKQSLQLRLGQQLAMTPQLQQAIKLLQLSTLELHQEIQQALDSNMMLEAAEDDGAFPESSDTVPVESAATDFQELPDLDKASDIPQELPIDSSWDEVYEGLQSYSNSLPDNDSDDFVFQRAQPQSLRDHLGWQLDMLPLSERDHAIGLAIVDAVNDEGYLSSPINDIVQSLQTQLDGLDPEEVTAVLHLVQNLDPAGVAAADLADCLAIQLRQLPEATPHRKKALELVQHYLEVLGKKDLARLKRVLDVNDAQLAEIVALIRTLEPKPGRLVQTGESQYVVPDVFVSKIGSQWVVNLNPDIAPKLRINPFYSGMVRRADSSADNVAMKNHLQEARWFIKSLHSRNETLLKVARSIVEHQKDFLEQGPMAMKPLVLRDVAEEVGMHESTISRVTTQKYMHTANGIFEFKYFFSSHVSTNAGGECSATAIKAHLRAIVDAENPEKPLSDHAIADIFKQKGINVARRTIAKYREALAIPPSNERRQVI